MIHLITALPGSFKTCSTLMHVNKYQQDELKEGRERNIYYYGIPIKENFLTHWIHFDYPDKWYDLPKNSIIVIDECQKDVCGFGAKSHLKEQDKTITELETHRHHGFDLFLITQGPHLVNSRLKALCNIHFHLVRKYGWEKAKLYRSEGIIKTPESTSSLKDVSYKWFKPDEKYYDYYESATMHTVKKRLPLIFIVGFFVILFFLYGLYRAYTVIISKRNNETVVSDVLPQSSQLKQQDNQQNKFSSFHRQDESEEFNPVIAYMPRVPNMPETAPAYDELRKPVVFPKPNCVSQGDRCECYSQQGTLMHDYPKLVCQKYVENGYFDPTKLPSPNRHQIYVPKLIEDDKNDEEPKKYQSIATMEWS